MKIKSKEKCKDNAEFNDDKVKEEYDPPWTITLIHLMDESADSLQEFIS